MKILFYSNKCEYSKKILLYLEKNNIKDQFKLICVDNQKLPNDIKIVPTIIDMNLNEVMEGRKAFEYLQNIKYFNNPTNNIENAAKLPANPKIEQDKLAPKIDIGLELIDTHTDMKQVDTKQVDAKQVDAKQVDMKQVDVKQVDAKQVDVKQIPIVKRNVLIQFRR